MQLRSIFDKKLRLSSCSVTLMVVVDNVRKRITPDTKIGFTKGDP